MVCVVCIHVTEHGHPVSIIVVCMYWLYICEACCARYRQLKVYWSHTDLNVPATIHSANMDGTNEQVLVHTDLLFVSKLTPTSYGI